MITFATVGPVYHTLAEVVPLWVAVSCVVVSLLWFAVRGIVRANTPLFSWLTAPFGGPRDWVWLCIGCVILLLALDFPGFTRGFPRADDFALVQDAREMTSLREYVALYHNDHSLPLFRLLIAAIVRLQGPSATAQQMAAAFNFANFATYLALLLSGAWVLRELQARRIAIGLFCGVLWAWPSWGEFTAGYYTLAIYPLTVAFAFAGLAALQRGVTQSAPGYLAWSLAAGFLAAVVDVSGLWVFPLLWIAALTCLRTSARKRHVLMYATGVTAAAALVALFHLVWLAHPFTARELVQNPTAGTVHGLMRIPTAAEALWRLPLAFLTTIGGLVFSAIAAPAIGGIGVNPAALAGASRGLLAAEVLLSGAVGLLAIRTLAHLQNQERTMCAVLTFPIAATLAMTILARHAMLPAAFTLWPAKYKVMPYCWAVLLGCYSVDRSLSSKCPSVTLRVQRATWMAILMLWTAVPHWQIERALNLNHAWQPGGRFHNVAVADKRRRDFATFQADICRVAKVSGHHQLPWPAGFTGYDAYPFLEVGNHVTLGANYLPTDLLSIAPSAGVTLTPTAPSRIPADVMAAGDGVRHLHAVFATGL